MNTELNRAAVHKLVDELSDAELRTARRYLERLKLSPAERSARDERDAEIINTNADELRREMDDVLGYQADW